MSDPTKPTKQEMRRFMRYVAALIGVGALGSDGYADCRLLRNKPE